jgi:hypothetical protein
MQFASNSADRVGEKVLSSPDIEFEFSTESSQPFIREFCQSVMGDAKAQR